MAVTPRLDLKQTQSLLMTPELRQAINLLQVSNLELSSLIEKELEANPFLEREDEHLETFETKEQTIDDYDTPAQAPEEEFSPDIDYNNQFDDFGSDREGYDEAGQPGWQDYSDHKDHTADDNYDYFSQKLADEDSLFQLLQKQISLHFTSPKQQAIAFILAEQLDEAGYFRGSTADIAAKLKTPEPEITDVLTQLKTFEPSGIFAQSLAECLKIQLSDLNRLDPVAEKVLDNLELLGEKKYKELKKLCNIDDEDLLSVIEDIKSLNPKPAAHYAQDMTSYVIPDVFVRRHKDGSYRIELNQMSLPRVLINHEYFSEIKNSGDKKSRQYLKQQLGSASFLIKALHQRATTILKVSEEIVKNQYDFFEHGIEHLKPMQLKTIAEAVEMHESTISRVTSNKYMHTPLGIFELKYFFSNAAGSYIGNENTSTLAIKHKIKKLIEDEKPENILSDDAIVALLGQEGIKIARRTVTKYREAMEIPSSSARKRQKRSTL